MTAPLDHTLDITCPGCRTELLVTLERVHRGETVICARCGERFSLQPADLVPWAARETHQPPDALWTA